MPIQLNDLACTTGFQNNCGLASLAHVLVRNLDQLHTVEHRRGSFATNAQIQFYQQFLQYYGLSEAELSWETLASELKKIGLPEDPHFNPARLEVLLGPVMRKALQLHQRLRGSPVTADADPIEDLEVFHLAKFLGITLESYSHEDPQTNRVEHLAAPEVVLDTLKLYNTGRHWEFEMPHAATRARHNQFYQVDHRSRARGFEFNSDHLERVKVKIKEAVCQQHSFFRAFDAIEKNESETEFRLPNIPLAEPFKGFYTIFKQAQETLEAVFPNSALKTLLTGVFKFMVGIFVPITQMFEHLGKFFERPAPAPVAEAAEPREREMGEVSHPDLATRLAGATNAFRGVPVAGAEAREAAQSFSPFVGTSYQLSNSQQPRVNIEEVPDDNVLSGTASPSV